MMAPSDQCEALHCKFGFYISLVMSDAEYLFMFISYLYVFLGEMLSYILYVI